MLVSIAPPASKTRAVLVGGEKRLVTASTCHEPAAEDYAGNRRRNGRAQGNYRPLPPFCTLR
jgi:hypothetical protein